MSTFETAHVQAILYTSGAHFRNNRFLGYFLAEHGEIFDGEPESSGPSDGTPRAVVRNHSGLLELSGSPDRLELNRYMADDSKIDVKKHMELAARLFDGYLSFLSLGLCRVGCDVYRLRPDEDPARTISRHFCRDQWIEGPINHPAEFAINTTKTYSMGGVLPVNSRVSCKSISLEPADEEAGATLPAILLEQEITTNWPEIDREQAQNFFQLAPEELEKILRLYFPLVEGIRS